VVLEGSGPSISSLDASDEVCKIRLGADIVFVEAGKVR
jgi:hypothetical protein